VETSVSRPWTRSRALRCLVDAPCGSPREVLEAQRGVVEQLPGGYGNGAGDRDEGLGLAAAFDHAAVALPPRTVWVFSAEVAASPWMHLRRYRLRADALARATGPD
jgi:hypothetical protein